MALENLTTYTEGDPNAVITVTSTKVNVVSIDGFDTGEYVYKDFGASFFDSINATYEILNSSDGTNYPTDGGLAFSSTANAYRGTLATTDPWNNFLGFSGTLRIYLARGSYIASDFFNATNSTIYYIWMERSAGSDTVTVKIYSNSSRTTLLDTLTVSGFGTSTKWRYCYPFVHHESAEGNCVMSQYIENVDLNLTAGSSFTTTPMMHMMQAINLM